MKNLKEEKLYIQTFREIRSYIITHELKAGDSLPTEQAMCQMLGVSRNVLREAIKSMELMGMIQSCPGRGTVVKEFNLDFIFQNVLFFTVGEERKPIHEMLMIRKAIELSYMRQAYLALTSEDIRNIRESLEAIKAKWQQRIFFHADDKVFHMTLFRHLNNSGLGRFQCIIKTLQHGHRQNHFAVLMWFEQAHKVGGDFPDQIGFRLYICICLLLQLSHRHNRCSSLLDFPYECCRVTHVNIIGVDIDGFCHQRHSVLATVITGMGVDIQLPPIVINGNEVTHCNAGCFA